MPMNKTPTSSHHARGSDWRKLKSQFVDLRALRVWIARKKVADWLAPTGDTASGEYHPNRCRAGSKNGGIT